jgi:hypothetical protein
MQRSGRARRMRAVSWLSFACLELRDRIRLSCSVIQISLRLCKKGKMEEKAETGRAWIDKPSSSKASGRASSALSSGYWNVFLKRVAIFKSLQLCLFCCS